MPQILGQEQTSVLSTGGITQNNINTLMNSSLHNKYSLNGNPNILNKPQPSQLDLNGITPVGYLANPPQ
jgi:hypothetical protein